MAFNHELARAIVRGRDRDFARFFAGRQSEIDRFNDALAELGDRDEHDPAASFLIYQGAPGCGKTSLVAHLQRQSPDGVLFVRVDEEHLASMSALKGLVGKAAVGKNPFYAKVGSGAVKAVGEMTRAKGAGERVGDFIEALVARRIKAVVLHRDEAQSIGPSEQPGLAVLHRDGLGIPTICLLTGLGHTDINLGNATGITRPSRNSILNMGEMSKAECGQSTRMMLDALDVTGTDDEEGRMAHVVAEMTDGWPHHLNGAQHALCEALIEVDGRLQEVDIERVSRQSDENRRAYYLGRLTNSVLADNPQFSALLVARADETRPSSVAALRQLCREERERSIWTDLPAPDKLASALIEKGAVTITMDGRCEVPIPSMAKWAASMADHHPASAPPTDWQAKNRSGGD